MKTIAIISPVGGAGRTMLTAALAGLLTARRHRVLAVECDPRNVLALYCGLREPAREGLVSALTDSTKGWGDAALETDDGALWLPWGGVDASGQLPDARHMAALASTLYTRPRWLREQLSYLDLPAHGVVLVDAATWPSVHAFQAVEAADLVMVVMPPEPVACAALPRLREALRTSGKASVYVANRISPASQLHTDIVALLRDTLGLALSAYRIHADAGIPEALARNLNFILSSPHSQAAHDLQGLATWLSSWVHESSAKTADGVA